MKALNWPGFLIKPTLFQCISRVGNILQNQKTKLKKSLRMRVSSIDYGGRKHSTENKKPPLFAMALTTLTINLKRYHSARAGDMCTDDRVSMIINRATASDMCIQVFRQCEFHIT